ncbi:MAG TPA: 8-amino-7-oxononanoate synthase [Acidimicrobiales bacterium]|nr:8-amino-7-oxononanoate synthase [Acidimicrobiales bacterium]
MIVPGGRETPSLWSTLVEARARRLKDDNRWRSPVTFDARGPEGVLGEDGTKVVAFASNDYLGLSLHPAVVAAAHEALDTWGTGAGASRLVTGSRPVHDELEAALAASTGSEAAAVFPTGFAANLGVLSALGDAGVRICSDELNHASIIDGARLSRAEVAVYRHGDTEHLEALLRAATGPAIVVSDLVFSMDGDTAPVAGIAEVCRRHGALLVLDEAHAVLGPDPSPALAGVDVLRVGTLSKSLGSLGGFVAGSRAFVDLVVNRARSYIFTTALTPPDAAAALAALRVATSAEGDRLRTRLANHVARVKPGHPSPIIPIVLGSDERAVAASAALREYGVWVPAIRPPTVPPGTARLRVTLSAAHTSMHIALLLEALDAVPAVPRPPAAAPAGPGPSDAAAGTGAAPDAPTAATR